MPVIRTKTSGKDSRPRAPGVFAIASTYIGTVVGAGFASGQEILQFFSIFGRNGSIGLVLATILFALFGVAAIMLGYQLGEPNHRKALVTAAGRRLGNALDIMITVFLFGTLVTMTAGAGALAWEEWGIPRTLGKGLFSALTLITTIFGLRGLVSAMKLISPLLIGSIVVVTIAASRLQPLSGQPLPPSSSVLDLPHLHHWFTSSLLYVAYNMLGATPVLITLGAHSLSARTAATGAIIGAITLGAAAALTNMALHTLGSSYRDFEVPMARIAALAVPGAGQWYGFILMAEIYTTAVASLFGFSQRASGSRHGFTVTAVLGMAAAFIASKASFAHLVGTIYSIGGLTGIPLLLVLLRCGILALKG